MRFIGSASGGSKPTTPTIGAATDDGTGTGVSVAFTPSTYIGKGTITYTATSSPGSLTASGAGSPITVSGLTTGTAYTFTVKGDTNYGVASDSSAASNSVTPASPSSFESIATATGTGSSGTITFSSIPQTYKHLQLRLMFLGTTDVGAQIRLRFNSDTGTNYAYHNLVGAGADGIGATGLASQDTIRLAGWYGLDGVGTVKPAVGIIDIHDYSSSTKNKTVRYFGGKDNNVDGAVDLSSGLWISTSAVDSITVYMASGNLATSSIAALYGITG